MSSMRTPQHLVDSETHDDHLMMMMILPPPLPDSLAGVMSGGVRNAQQALRQFMARLVATAQSRTYTIV